MSNQSPTTGQLERFLAQNIRKRYHTMLGLNPGKISCNIVGTQLTIIIEEAITKLENFLLKNEQNLVADCVHSDLEIAFLPELQATIQECLDAGILDIGITSMNNTNRTAIVAVLAQSPNMSAYKAAC